MDYNYDDQINFLDWVVHTEFLTDDLKNEIKEAKKQIGSREEVLLQKENILQTLEKKQLQIEEVLEKLEGKKDQLEEYYEALEEEIDTLQEEIENLEN